MEIRNSNAQPTNRLARPKSIALKTPEEMAAEWQRAEAERQRQQCLAGCPSDLAAFATGVCALVYHRFEVIQTRLAVELQPFAKCGSQAVAFERGAYDWIVFRGTESFPETEMFLDWGHDLLFAPWGWPPRHLGFARAWAKLREPLLDWVSTRAGGRGLVITGHSLGGALALAAAYDIACVRRARIEAVITFGAPRVGTWPWTAKYHRLSANLSYDEVPKRSLRDVTWRIHNEGDIVTYVPPIIFAHCGHPVSASRLQAGPSLLYAGAFPLAQEEGPGEGFFARLKYGYRGAKRVLPYSPVTLLVDLVLAIAETAPEHFMRHYAPAFPQRPFPDLNEPKESPGPKTLVNNILCGLKALILYLALLGLVVLGELAYRASPELAVGMLIATIVYAIAGYVPTQLWQPAPPPLLNRLQKIEESKRRG